MYHLFRTSWCLKFSHSSAIFWSITPNFLLLEIIRIEIDIFIYISDHVHSIAALPELWINFLHSLQPKLIWILRDGWVYPEFHAFMASFQFLGELNIHLGLLRFMELYSMFGLSGVCSTVTVSASDSTINLDLWIKRPDLRKMKPNFCNCRFLADNFGSCQRSKSSLVRDRALSELYKSLDLHVSNGNG